MLTSIYGLHAAKYLSTTLLASAAFTAVPALAQFGNQMPNTDPVDEEVSGPVTFLANVALTSEYRFRGVDQSGGELAVQGGFDVAHESGFYVGTWASSLEEDTVGFGSTDLGGGIPDTPITVTSHLGYTDGFLTFTNDSKAFDWSIGAEAAIPGTPASVGVAYVDAEGGIPVGAYDFVDDAVVLTLGASFWRRGGINRD